VNTVIVSFNTIIGQMTSPYQWKKHRITKTDIWSQMLKFLCEICYQQAFVYNLVIYKYLYGLMSSIKVGVVVNLLSNCQI